MSHVAKVLARLAAQSARPVWTLGAMASLIAAGINRVTAMCVWIKPACLGAAAVAI